MRSARRRFATFAAVVFLSFGLAGNPLAGQTSSGKLQLYFFTNPGCGPCRQVEPELEKLYQDGYSVMKIDTSVHPDWTQRFQIRRTPTVVLAAGNRVLARHSGFIDAATLKGWFQQAEPLVESDRPGDVGQTPVSQTRRSPISDTVHNGTRRPGCDAEQRALQATVRLKVDDPRGSSFATGTVIHCHEGDALVLTCGHVFRDSDGKGKITAEYGLEESGGSFSTGELIYYDANERDIGLVAISIEEPIEPVAIAEAGTSVVPGDAIFSIGCDHGDPPTIRRSEIKNQGKYDGVMKFDIVGRPVDGRSGGGLFTCDGELIGVCNAAVVDVDEGVFAALDSIHWQLETVNLAHLFKTEQPKSKALAKATPQPRPLAADSLVDVSMVDAGSVRSQRLADTPVRNSVENRLPISAEKSVAAAKTQPLLRGEVAPQLQSAGAAQANPVSVRAASPQPGTADELIVVLRSRNSRGATESWTITNPDEQLVDQLKMLRNGPSGGDRSNRLAQMRRDMPELPTDSGNNYPRDQYRAQSLR